MSAAGRRFVAAVVVGLVAVSLYRYLTGEPSSQRLLQLLGVILLWTPLKGALLRFLGGSRPYRSALAANASSETTGIGYPLAGLGMPWPALGASMILSTLVEWLAFLAVGTGKKVTACLWMSLYVNVVVHVLVAAFILWPGNRPASAGVFLVGFALFLLPIFLVNRQA
jgi:hypothetical protein